MKNSVERRMTSEVTKKIPGGKHLANYVGKMVILSDKLLKEKMRKKLHFVGNTFLCDNPDCFTVDKHRFSDLCGVCKTYKVYCSTGCAFYSCILYQCARCGVSNSVCAECQAGSDKYCKCE